MSDAELKNWIESTIIEKAPDGFTDRLMEAIAIEDEKSLAKSGYKLPGKYLLIFMALLLVFSIVVSFINPAEGMSEWANYSHYFQLDWSKLKFNGLISNHLITYTTAGLFLFLFLDYQFTSKKRFYSVQ